MKGVYEQPILTILSLSAEDIVTTSPGDNHTGDDFPAFGS